MYSIRIDVIPIDDDIAAPDVVAAQVGLHLSIQLYKAFLGTS
ncbi:hypothetical protein VB741_23510 [Leptothoe sp. PORK10 BA2]|nr:hypothetical protein [Leptothoe sp. PORK10 BA2]